MVVLEPGDAVSLVLSTRIGTNPDGTKYPGHANATGLRLYYDSVERPTQLGRPRALEIHRAGNAHSVLVKTLE